MKFFPTLTTLIILCATFKQSAAAPAAEGRHSLITDTVTYTGLRISEPLMERLIEARKIDTATSRQIRRFYESRDYQFAWFTEEGLAEQTQTFWNLYEQYENFSKDTIFRDAELKEQMEFLGSNEYSINMQNHRMDTLEIRLTEFFIQFLKRAYAGKIDPEKLQWHIPRKKLNVVGLLDEFMTTDAKDLQSWLPVSDEYLAMKEKVLRFQSLPQNDWPLIALNDQKVLRPGDTASTLKLIKNRLTVLGDLEVPDTSALYTKKFKNAVEAFQRRHGLTVDGIIGPAFMRAVNIPIATKVKQMLINMERMRWMPLHQQGKSVVVNIPEYRLHVYDGLEEILAMDVVVGKAATRTVVFSDLIKNVVFSPYWNLPQSIVRNEVLPGIARNSDYLDRHRMEITGNRNGLPVVRQKPGAGNALGRVKFIFPNTYSIYLHDTLAKQLFDRTRRAFSHGCIRVSDPAALAKNLLETRPGWTPERIAEAMTADLEAWVSVKEPVPVYITYFTSWVDHSGKLNFRNDIYGHDKKLASHLFKR